MATVHCCGSGICPGSEFFPSRIRIKEFRYFNPKNCFLIPTSAFSLDLSEPVKKSLPKTTSYQPLSRSAVSDQYVDLQINLFFWCPSPPPWCPPLVAYLLLRLSVLPGEKKSFRIFFALSASRLYSVHLIWPKTIHLCVPLTVMDVCLYFAEINHLCFMSVCPLSWPGRTASCTYPSSSLESARWVVFF